MGTKRGKYLVAHKSDGTWKNAWNEQEAKKKRDQRGGEMERKNTIRDRLTDRSKRRRGK